MASAVYFVLWAALLGASPRPLDAAELVTAIGPWEPRPEALEIGGEIDKLHRSAFNPGVSIPRLYETSHDLLDRLPETKIIVNARPRLWDRDPEPPVTPATVDRLIQSARKRLDEADSVPAPEVVDAYRHAQDMNNSGHMNYDALKPEQMGVYEYFLDKSKAGTIKLNTLLAAVSTKMGDAWAFATPLHEAQHSLDEKTGKAVKESKAFRTQYDWVTFIDPFGERLAFLITKLMSEVRETASELAKAVLAYATHLRQLRATKGDESKIKTMMATLDYDGDEPHPHP